MRFSAGASEISICGCCLWRVFWVFDGVWSETDYKCIREGRVMASALCWNEQCIRNSPQGRRHDQEYSTDNDGYRSGVHTGLCLHWGSLIFSYSWTSFFERVLASTHICWHIYLLEGLDADSKFTCQDTSITVQYSDETPQTDIS